MASDTERLDWLQLERPKIIWPSMPLMFFVIDGGVGQYHYAQSRHGLREAIDAAMAAEEAERDEAER